MTSDTFPHEYIPTIVDYGSIDYVHDGKFFSLTLWDTAGSEDYDR